MIAALIFDVDGTLAETEEYHRRAFNQAFVQSGLDWYWDDAMYRALLATTGGKERMLAFVADGFPEMLAAFRARVGEIHRLKTQLYTAAVAAGRVPLRPGITELLAQARAAGVTCAIATTTSMENVDALLSAALGAAWRDTFPVVAAGDMVANKKPAPDVYRLALSKLGYPAENSLAVEDSRNGVLSALAAGIPVVAVRSAYTCGDDLTHAVKVFDDPTSVSFAELQGVIERR
jgi:HAD superfamily hydrolase (TIGR01509 family)